MEKLVNEALVTPTPGLLLNQIINCHDIDFVKCGYSYLFTDSQIYQPKIFQCWGMIVYANIYLCIP